MRGGAIGGCFIAVFADPATAEGLVTLPVVEARESAMEPGRYELELPPLELGVPADGGALLRRVPGVDGSRLGGPFFPSPPKPT